LQSTAHFNEVLLQRAAEFLSGRSPVLILAGTREAAADLARRAAGPATLGVYTTTLQELIVTLAERPMNERGLTPVSRLAREALMARIIAGVRSKMTYLGPVASFPGFPRAALRTVDTLRLNRIAPEHVANTGRSGPDLALLLDEYERQLTEHRFADNADRARIAIDVVDEASHNWCGMPLLLLDPRPANRAETLLLNRLRACASEVFDDEARDVPEPPLNCLESLRQRVFTGTAGEAREKDASVRLLAASGEALECAEIARSILTLAAQGVPFDRTAVLLRSPIRYQPLLDEAFHRAGIRPWYSRGTRRPDVAGRAFLALLRCAAEDFSAIRFAEYLSIGQMPAEPGEPRPVNHWERLLTRAGVVGGLERWDRRLAGFINDLELKLENASTDSERNQIVRDIGATESLRGWALPVLRELAALPSGATWGAWLDALSGLARRTVDRSYRITETLEHLRPMADLGPVSIGDILAVLEREFGTLPQDGPETRYGAVFVGGIEEAVGLHFHSVFVPGMNEGVFPKTVREDPLLLDTQCRDLDIPGSQDDALLLKTAIACAGESFNASWSRIDLATGRERVPSFYAFEIAESAWGGEIDPATLEREAAASVHTRLGWPAPSTTDAAVDDIEYDLARLHPYWKEPAEGVALYLRQVNPIVYRSLIARAFRWSDSWKWSDGLLPDNELTEAAVRKYRLTTHAFQTTDLEQYARCPYRFLLKGIYGLRALETPEAVQRMEPGIRGTLFHAVVEALFAKVPDVNPENLPLALDELDSLLWEASNKLMAQLAPAVPMVWQLDVEQLRADLRGWLVHVADETAWKPLHLEWRFEELLLDKYRVGGRVDLIEENAAGQLRITDLKTGKAPRKVQDEPRTTGRGEVLQPVLYALATGQKLGRHVAASRLFYATIRNNYSEFPILLEQGITGTAAVLACIDKALDKAFLPAAPRPDACEHCDYLPVCGPYEEERWERKPPSDVVALHQIRGRQ